MVRATIIIEAIRDNDYVGHAACMGEYFLEGLKNIEGLENVRGVGLMIAFDLATSEKRDKLVGNLQAHNVLPLKCGDKGVRFRPHLTITKSEVNFAVGKVKEYANN
jgi:L-lysine 6-transaminase